jgi:hypothetical protein
VLIDERRKLKHEYERLPSIRSLGAPCLENMSKMIQRPAQPKGAAAQHEVRELDVEVGDGHRSTVSRAR